MIKSLFEISLKTLVVASTSIVVVDVYMTTRENLAEKNKATQ